MKREPSNHGHGHRYCSGCQIKFGSAERRTTKNSKEYHSHCYAKLQGKGNVATHPEAVLQTIELEDGMMLDEQYLERLYLM